MLSSFHEMLSQSMKRVSFTTGQIMLSYVIISRIKILIRSRFEFGSPTLYTVTLSSIPQSFLQLLPSDQLPPDSHCYFVLMEENIHSCINYTATSILALIVMKL